MILQLRFPNSSSREQSILVSELKPVIAPFVDQADIVKERENTLDPGTMLSIILDPTAVAATIAAVGAWLVRNNQTDVDICDEKGFRASFRNITPEHVAAAIKALKTWHK
jgi:hypothetical protein